MLIKNFNSNPTLKLKLWLKYQRYDKIDYE